MTKGSSKKPYSGREGESVELASESLTSVKSNQIVICKQTGCHDISTIHGFCRFHYLASWKKLKTKEAKKKGQELKTYLEDLGRRFPEEFIEKLKSEMEELSEKEAVSGDADEADKGSLFDQMDGDEDLDTIIKGLKVEDI